MTIIEAMAEAIRISKTKDALIYLCETPNAYRFTPNWERGWLFQAYPGGRKVLSVKGKQLIRKTHCLCGREWSDMGHCYYCNKFKPTSA